MVKFMDRTLTFMSCHALSIDCLKDLFSDHRVMMLNLSCYSSLIMSRALNLHSFTSTYKCLTCGSKSTWFSTWPEAKEVLSLTKREENRNHITQLTMWVWRANYDTITSLFAWSKVKESRTEVSDMGVRVECVTNRRGSSNLFSC